MLELLVQLTTQALFSSVEPMSDKSVGVSVMRREAMRSVVCLS